MNGKPGDYRTFAVHVSDGNSSGAFDADGTFSGLNFGGSISAILINTPGTNAAAATLIDGYPMCKKGQPRRALDMALVASTVGGLISALCLLFFAPQISKVAITFGSPEYFALAVFGLSVIASVSGKSLVKGLISGGLGILLATVGIDSVSGAHRKIYLLEICGCITALRCWQCCWVYMPLPR